MCRELLRHLWSRGRRSEDVTTGNIEFVSQGGHDYAAASRRPRRDNTEPQGGRSQQNWRSLNDLWSLRWGTGSCSPRLTAGEQ